MLKHCTIPLIAALLWGGAFAEVARADRTELRSGSPFTIDVWDTEDGLPQNSVIAMIQSRDGYLWLGTLNGLARFDGRRFTVFDGGNTPELKSGCIVKLFEDSGTNLWVGTESAGVIRVTPAGSSTLQVGAAGREGRVAGICEDARGVVWLYTADGQLGNYRAGKLEVASVSPNQPSFCRALIAEKDGPVWVGTDWRQRGIQPGTDFRGAELPLALELPGKLDFLVASERGGYWRLAEGRIQRWTTNRIVQDFGAYPWGLQQISAACEDREGNLVVGTLGAGLYWFDAAGAVTHLTTREGLSMNYILSLTVDREGSLWVGTDGGGLNRVKRQAFAVVAAARELTVQSVCEGATNGLWIGINSAGLNFLEGDRLKTYGPAEGLLNLFVRSVFVDRKQQTWVGTFGGLFRWETNQFALAPGAAALSPRVTAIFEDRAGRLWVGTQAGLACREADAWRIFTTRDGLAADDVRALAEDAQGNLWIGTSAGLNRWRDGRFTAGPQNAELTRVEITSLFVDAAGDLWVGSAGSGLARLRQGRWTRYTTADGLISNSIGYVIEDKLGNLWVGSYAGLMRLALAALNDYAPGATNRLACRVYGRSDGLPTSECTQGSQPTACRTRDGRLWFPTVKGLVSVDPAKLGRNLTPPPVVIESVTVDGRATSASRLRAALPGAVTIQPGEERLEVQFTSLNLAARDRARFKYRLEGYEKVWNEVAGETRTASYPKLSPGRYRFCVTAANEDGVWNDIGSTLAVVVLPPFWRTWWFLGLSGLALLAAIVGVVNYISTQKYRRELEALRQHEALEKDRARIARDIHDQLGASLTQVALLGEFVESDKDSPAEVEALGRQISQTARDTTHALDEIVWTVNPANDTVDGLITYVCKHAQDYLGVAGLQYRLDVPEKLPGATISPELRHNIFLAAKEAITNVVKHARATSVWVRVRIATTEFILEITDDGCGGADPAGKSTRNGFRNMRKRMEDVGGKFTIGPADAGGTVVRLTAPLENQT